MTRQRAEGLVLGVTGGIACGKSEVGRILEGLGFEVLDADRVAHSLLAPETEETRKVVGRFGERVCDSHGGIDRARLAEIVFADEKSRADLNAILHPPVLRHCRAWVLKRGGSGGRLAVLMPLLFEVGETGLWDAVVCVSADTDTVLERLKARGLSREDALMRIDAQMPLDEKIRRSDYVIENNSDRTDLARKVESLLVLIENNEREE